MSKNEDKLPSKKFKIVRSISFILFYSIMHILGVFYGKNAVYAFFLWPSIFILILILYVLVPKGIIVKDSDMYLWITTVVFSSASSSVVYFIINVYFGVN